MGYRNLLASLFSIGVFIEMAGHTKGEIPNASLYITDRREVTDPIVKLLGLTGIRIQGDPLPAGKEWPEAKLYLKSRALEEVVLATQGKIEPTLTWLGDLEKERWEEDPKKITFLPVQAKEMMDICLKGLKLGDKVTPSSTPKAILFLGDDLSGSRLRLAYLNSLIEEKKLLPSLPIYVLTGERKLDEKAGETGDEFMNPANGILPFRKDWKRPEKLNITDEGEMIKLVFAQSRHREIDEKNIHFVYAPKGLQKRATTASTVEQWLQTSPKKGLYVAVSDQPYAFYQECVIRRVLLQNNRSDIVVKVIGPGLEESKVEATEQQAQDFLGNISRILYELLTIHNL